MAYKHRNLLFYNVDDNSSFIFDDTFSANYSDGSSGLSPNLSNTTLDGTDPDCIVRGEETNGFFHFLMYGILLNAVGLMGLVGNAISITILSRPNMRSSINCCLVGLASFDTLLLLTSLLMFGLEAIPEYTGNLIWYHTDIFPYVVQAAYPLGVIAQTGSVYLTVTVTLERYVAVCHPLKARSICTYGRAKFYVIAVAVFSLLYNFPRFWEITYKKCVLSNITFTAVVMTRLRRNEAYLKIYINWMYLIIMYLLPFLSLLIFNAFIYIQVRKANHELQRLSRLQRKELSLTVMLLCVVVVFFLCNILALIVNVLEMLDIVLTSLTMLSNLLVTVNSSVNFIIYCIFGQKFRRLFLQLFCYGALKKYAGPEMESAVGGNSIYGGSMRTESNRVTHIQSTRLASWNTQGINRVTANNRNWQVGRSILPSVGSRQYTPVLSTESKKSMMADKNYTETSFLTNDKCEKNSSEGLLS